MVTNETESILFFISNQDASKRSTLRKTKRRIALDYYYRIRLEKLNELLSMIAQLQDLKKKKTN